MDRHQANFQLHLLLVISPLRFNSTPTFHGVTFDQTLFFFEQVSSLKAKFFPRIKALRCISASSRGLSKEFLSLLYKAFLRPLFTYALIGWLPILGVTNIIKLEGFYEVPSRAITACLLCSPIPLVLFEASLPYLRVAHPESFQSHVMSRVARVATFGNKLLSFACKFEISYFCYNATKSCWYFT